MKLYTIKFANGKYLSRLNKKVGEGIGAKMTEDINEAYIYHNIDDLIYKIEGGKDLFPGSYDATMKAGGGSYEPIEVKIVEV